MNNIFKVSLIIPTLNTKNGSNIKFIWRILRLIFEIIMNLSNFLKNKY
jgi:hypothetical protein